MNSILNNSAALSALQSLNMTQQSLATVQNQVSTGLSVSSAADNASYWSIATQLNSDSSITSAASSALSTGQAILDTANTAINQVITAITSIQQALTQATNPSANLTNIGTTLVSLGQQLTDAVSGANFNGANVLDGSYGLTPAVQNSGNITPTATGSISFVSGFNAANNNVTSVQLSLQALYGTTLSSGAATVGATTATAGIGILGSAVGTVAGQTMSYDLTQLAYYGGGGQGATTVASLTSSVGFSTLSATNLQDMLTAVNAALSSVTNYAASIGATQDRMSAMSNLNSALTTNYANGISGLVDADMNTASTRLQALQTQQQLGIQSLSIANQNAQLILKLFP